MRTREENPVTLNQVRYREKITESFITDFKTLAQKLLAPSGSNRMVLSHTHQVSFDDSFICCGTEISCLSH